MDADAGPFTVLASILLSAMGTYACSSAVFTLGPYSAMNADASTSTVFAC